MGTLLQDVRYALRMMAKSPGFTLIAILTLALGIGANTAIFSLTDQVLLRDLPVRNPQELVLLHSPGPNPGHTWSDADDGSSFSYPLYQDLRDRAPAFSGLIARFHVDLSVAAHDGTERAGGELVSGNYFDVLGVRPALGRLLGAEDETASGANPVAVLSYGYWTRRFGGDPAILNKQLTVNGTLLTVVGVSQPGFFGVQIGQTPDLFVPLTMKPQIFPGYDALDARQDHWLSLIGRLKPGFTPQRAEAAVAPSYHAILAADLSSQKMSGKVAKAYGDKKLLFDPGEHGREILQRNVRAPMLSLLAMVGLALLIACANLASLLVAQGEARQREIAVRLALGAGRGRLIRQLLTESLLLALAGGAAGIALGSWTLKTLVGSIPASAGMAGMNPRLDGRVMLFAAALTLGTSFLFGLAPALRASRIKIQTMLKDQGASVSAGASDVRLRKWLVASQVALTVVLLAGAGFFVQSLLHLKQVALGVRTSHVVQFELDPRDSGYTRAQTTALFDRLRDAVAALPGVQSVSAAEIPLFQDDDSSGNLTIEGYQVRPDEDIDVYRNMVGPDYFATLGIPLLAGREFRPSDTADSPKVAIINRQTARRYFAGRNPIGLHLARGAGDGVHLDTEIVGVVADSKHSSVREESKPFVFYPYSQDPLLEDATFYVRTGQQPASLIVTLKKTVAKFDASLPLFNAMSLDDQVDESVYSDRLLTFFSLSLAALAALLAALGLYGVLAFVVARRTREIGIRIALGATSQHVSRLIFREVLSVCAAGIGVGLAAAWLVGHLIASQLYGVKPGSPPVFLAAALLLSSVALAACYFPARRATRVDPMVALRYE
jgi:predicted permease